MCGLMFSPKIWEERGFECWLCTFFAACWADTVASRAGVGPQDTAGRENQNQSRYVGWVESVNVQDEAFVALDTHIRFLIE